MAEEKKTPEEQQEKDLGISPEIKKKLKAIKESIDKFKAEVLKKFDTYIIGMELIPPPRLTEEEFNKLPETDKEQLKNQINVFILVDDEDSKKMSKEELKSKLIDIINKLAEDADKNIKPEIMLISELKESCFDGKYELLQMIGAGMILYDKGMLGALKVAEVHKTMTIRKFEKYVLSYVAVGSLFRGDANPNDIDVYIVIDDTDVKKMSRLELKDKLRAIIAGMGFEASKVTGVEASFHVQTYILTDFWDSVKDANPVIYTFLRDGVPLFDRGVFMPWKLLLEMGRIKPSPEAIDMNMDIGEKLLQRVKHKLLSVVGEDLYYAALNPAQAALMLYGLPPSTPKETVQLIDDIFVKKEKLLEKKYVDILEKIRKAYKDIEHGKTKEITGKEIDNLLFDIEAYLKRIQRLFIQIEKKTEVKTIEDTYDMISTVTNDAIQSVTKKNVNNTEKDLKAMLIDTGKLPEKVLKMYRDLMKIRKDYENKKLAKQEIIKLNKDARLYVKILIEFIQRLRGAELERAKVRFKYEKNVGELLLLDKVAYITPKLDDRETIQKADITKEGGIKNVQKSSLEEMEQDIVKVKIPDNVFIKEKIFEDLRELFGNDIEIMVSS